MFILLFLFIFELLINLLYMKSKIISISSLMDDINILSKLDFDVPGYYCIFDADFIALYRNGFLIFAEDSPEEFSRHLWKYISSLRFSKKG